jgi:hypothetical protein
MKSRTTTWYMPVGIRADGTLKYYHCHKHTDIEVAKQNIEEIKKDIEAHPDLFENCAEFKIMKRTETITTTEWEDAE